MPALMDNRNELSWFMVD